jgi:hypothetical protein
MKVNLLLSVFLYTLSMEFEIPDPLQGIICFVAFDRSSLRRIVHTPQSSLLGALHLIPCRGSGMLHNPYILFLIALNRVVDLGQPFGPAKYL